METTNPDPGGSLFGGIKAKVLALIAVLGLGTGATLVLTKDGCQVKPVEPTPIVDAGTATPAPEVPPVTTVPVTEPAK